MVTSPTTSNNLFSVAMISATDGWAVGDLGTILRWNGSVWSAVSSPTTQLLNSVAMVSATDGWAVGGWGDTILRWNGSAWSVVSSPISSWFYSVAMVSATDGWAVGIFGTILRWNGSAWSVVSSPTAQSLYSVTMLSATDGWAVGWNGTIVRWNGSAWSTVSSPTTQPLNSVAMVSSTDGWAVSDGGTILRWNGSAWSAVSSTAQSPNSVAMVSSTDGWAVGGLGTILRWNGSAWRVVSSPTTQSLYSVTMLSATDGWAVGWNGTIVRWNGSAWNTVSSPTTQSPKSVAMVSSTDGWAVGDSGTILRWNGSVWSVVSSPTTGSLFSVSLVSAADGWAVGGRDTILHWNGSAWNAVSTPTASSLYSVAMVSATDGWAVGALGRILHWNGSAWVSVNSPTIYDDLSSVAMVSATEGWAVGGYTYGGMDSRILHWNGSTWTLVSSPTFDYLSSVSMVSATNGWAVGYEGTILHWDGNTWIAVNSPTTYWLHSVAMVPGTNGKDAWAVGDGGVILRFTGGIVGPPYSTSPIYPASNDTPSTVMQGGTAYRYFRLFGAGNQPVPGATVAFSAIVSTTTDANGYITAVIPADTLGGPGSYQVGVQSVTEGGQTTSTNGQPVFGVEMGERTYSNSWSYGAIRSASAGISTGLIAYLQAESNGGLGLTLEESDPNRTDDDKVQMEEKYSAEVAGGVGVGLRSNIKAAIVKADLDASVTTEASLRTFGSLQADFDQPYADTDRKAQGIFLALSVLDSASGTQIQPLVVSLLQIAEPRLPYLDYIAAQSVGLGAKVTPLQANIGADVSLAAQRGSSQRKAMTLGFTLLDVGASRLVTAVLTDYGDEYSAGFEDEFSVDLTTLSPNIPFVKTRLIGLLDHQARRIHKEYFFDSATDQLKRIELTLSSEGNPSAFTDVTKKQVSTKITIAGPNLTPSLVNAVGQAQVVSDLNALFSAAPEMSYEAAVEDGSSVSVVPELSIPGTEIKVGLGLEVEQLRNLVRERGVFLNGQPYVTETYSADSYVSQPGKTWIDLTTNALGGLWLLVQDAFNWVSLQVASGLQWTLDVIARTTTGVLYGGAQLAVPPGAQLQAASTANNPAMQVTDPITVTAIGWASEIISGTGVLALNPASVTASGAGFVVGGIYEFQPYTLTISPAATLVITYTDAAAAGVNENQIGMFHWNPTGNNWQPVTAQADAAANTFTAIVTQLGTYALGYDATPPEISIVDPISGSTINNSLPLVRALVADMGVGIDPATVQMSLDGQVVLGTYVTGTGQLAYLPGASLANGPHTVTVSAADVVGNASITATTFTVDVKYPLYLPLIMR